MGKVMNQAKLAILSESKLLQWEKILKSCETGKIGCSKSFCATSMGKDWKSCESGKIGHSESF